MMVNPETRIGPLLDEHPELEAVLVKLSPEFKRLQNPILRQTVARVATLSQAAKIGGVAIPELVRVLRRALGEEEGGTCGHVAPDARDEEPAWLGGATPVARLDADEILGRGGTPVGEISARLSHAAPGEVVLLLAPFYPAPMVDGLRGKGHDVYTRPARAGAWEVWARRGLLS
jgi:hypothetical protein